MERKAYSRRIKQLRAALRLTQHELAERLHVRPQVVASWEQGRKEPSATSYQQLARLAPPKEAWFFLEQMGVTKDLVRSKWPGRAAAPTRERGSPGAAKVRFRMLEDRKHQHMQIPVLRDGAPADRHPISESDIESFIAVPANYLGKTSGDYLAVRLCGDSMMPILRDGFLVVVNRVHRDAARLRGQMVAVRSKDRLLVGWLAEESSSGRLVLRAENPRYPVLSLESPAAGRIIGEVVFWCGMPR